MAHWFPFISVRAHREVLASKDETIALLREQVKQYTDSLESFREAMKAVHTAQAQQPRRRESSAEKEPPKPIDFASVDPNDNEALMKLAVAEVGPATKVSSVHLMRRVEHLRNQAIDMRRRRMQKALEPLDHPIPSVSSPEELEALIAQAEQEGAAAAARVN